MLKALYPKAYSRYLALPLLGSMVDEFDDWLLAQGYRWNTRQPYIHKTAALDQFFRKQGRSQVAQLTRDDLAGCWHWYHSRDQQAACAVHLLVKFLDHKGLLSALEATPLTPFDSEMAAYQAHLEDLRGFAAKTVRAHVDTTRQFLIYLTDQRSQRQLTELTPAVIEDFITLVGERNNRASLQHVVAHLRGFLRFLAVTGKVSTRLCEGIDTPRCYRLERLPQTLSWEMVQAFLQAIDQTALTGLRDFTMFSLIATYGLRSCDLIALTLDDINWERGELWIRQQKTGCPLVLPLTDAVGEVLVRYLRSGRPSLPFRQLFLRVKAPNGPLGRTAVSDAFQAWVRRSGLPIPFQGAHCLRHAYAVNLLRQGTSLKAIGDVLGHRTSESTCLYLRLAIEDLREVALPLPQTAPALKRKETV